MLSDYFILGLRENATDAEIRRQYLMLAKKYPPEKHPERFQDITESYERIKSGRLALESRLLGGLKILEPDAVLLPLGRSVHMARKPAGLQELLTAADLKVDHGKK